VEHISWRWCRHWLHSESWWPRLFKDGPEIAWDDYEKDYSDLPAQVMAEHAALEGAKEVTRQLEAGEKLERDRIQAGGFTFSMRCQWEGRKLLWRVMEHVAEYLKSLGRKYEWTRKVISLLSEPRQAGILAMRRLPKPKQAES